ncbi:hypothetical protein FK529_13125 [Tsukamurella asaccharolytica]|uniref:DUF975 family protein n=1 Tax=Tsukamurella asaccharolytica TaxID=2592067 RepID=A0A5C5R7X0_9ACTN|nr:hypothetical protein [Tsukamurella asaccharolytica]TWS18918.1 hypothetical protein FK529_13125 [Tsukamurella asaccharolytica]
MTQPPNYPGDNQGGYPQNPQDPQPGGYPQGGYPQQPPQQPGYGQQGGDFPPPAGGFPPPAGGFPPPQDPGYGQGGQGFPPPPPQGGFPPPPPGGFGGPQYGGGQQPFNIGDAFSWAWNKFTKNALALIVAVLVYTLVLGAILGLGYLLLGSIILGSSSVDAEGFTEISTGGSIGAVVGFAVLLLVTAIVGCIIQASFYSGLLDIADGKPVDIGSFFKPRNTAQVALAAVLIGVVTAILSLIPFLGSILSIVVGFLTMFAIPTIVDRGLPAIDGIKQGFATVQRDLGSSILTYVIAFLIGAVGVCLCAVGLLIAGPIAALLVVYAYRRLSGGQVAPLTP